MNRSPQLPPPPKVAYDLVRQLWENETPPDDQRHEPRFPTVATLRVQPLSDALQPQGEPFLAVLRDVSARGISFVHTRALKHGFILVEFQEPSVSAPSLLVTTVWCKPVRTCYLIAGRIISKCPTIQDDPQRSET